MSKLKASFHVGVGFPTDEGRKYAEVLLGKGEPLSGLTIDLHGCSASVLISAFFNAFLQTVHDLQPECLAEAKGITWEPAHDFQDRNIRRWVQDFEPTPLA